MSHAAFLGLAYGLTVVLLAVEPVLVWRRHRAARRALGGSGADGTGRAEPAA